MTNLRPITDAGPIKHPAWKQAVDEFLALRVQPGHVVTKEWLVAALRLETPQTIEDKEKFDLAYLSGVDQFRSELLEKQCLAFKTIRGEGLQLLTAQEQIDWALEERDRLIGKSLRDGAKRLLYLRSNELTAEQRAAHADLLARHANLAGVIKRTRSLPSAFKEMLEHKKEGDE